MLQGFVRWIALSATVALVVAVLCAPGAPAAPTASAARVKSCPGFSFSAASLGGQAKATHVKRTSHINCAKAKNLIRAVYHSGPLKVIHARVGSGHPILWVAGGWRCSFTATLTTGGHEAYCRSVTHRSWNEIDALDAVTAIIPF